MVEAVVVAAEEEEEAEVVVVEVDEEALEAQKERNIHQKKSNVRFLWLIVVFICENFNCSISSSCFPIG